MPPASNSALEGELTLSPSVYPQKLDLARNQVLLIRMRPEEYRAASFLDDRILTQRTEGRWIAYAIVKLSAAAAPAPRPIHFIFHSGHVGSTLLSRLLDESQAVLGLREPLPLRTLADVHDRALNPEQSHVVTTFADYRDTFLRLWARGFPETELVVIKATSTTGRIAAALMESAPTARAIYLNLSAESYLATLLAGENASVDLKGFLPERLQRLRRLLAADLPIEADTSPGRMAALSWLTERLTQANAGNLLSDRLIDIDFEAMLEDIDATILRIAQHFGIPGAQDLASRASTSPILSRYSKAPEQYAYSRSFRRQLLAQARRDHAKEIREGLALLEALASRFAAVGKVL